MWVEYLTSNNHLTTTINSSVNFYIYSAKQTEIMRASSAGEEGIFLETLAIMILSRNPRCDLSNCSIVSIATVSIHIATIQPTTQNNLKQLLLVRYYNQ
jgi:hypothetical protein